MNVQNSANHILVDLDRVDELFLRSLRTRAVPALGRKQRAVFSFTQHRVQMEQSGSLQNDGGTVGACPAHEQGAQTGDDPVGGAQVGSTFATAIEDQQLVPNQRGFGNNGAESAGSCQPDNGDDQMNEKDEEVAHSRQSYQHLKVTSFRQF
jgi:hypothetical protein